jgi:16S rRNA A1518/A1519 N6-dimethyltransferase RsmA/KsgA/DIM1 with predicted DNA glycosylase/AP lyase activity
MVVLMGSKRLVGAALARRRKTLENHLQLIYPNLKDHLRLLYLSGSRRAETLSVVEFARLAKSLGSLAGGPKGRRGTKWRR